MTNLGALLDPVVAAAPDRAALVIDGEVISYSELGHAVASVANALADMGVGGGDRVMLVDECSPLFLGTVLGAARIGAAAAPVSHRLAPPELRALHELAGCDRSVAGADSIGLVGDALGRSPLAASVLLRWGGEPPEPAEVNPADTALVLFTSGTTGLPKPVPLPHGDLVPRVSLFASAFDPAAAPTVALVCVPVVHIGGLVGLLVALAAGTTSVVQRRFDAAEWLDLVERHRVERTFLVPAQLSRILDHPSFPSADLSSLQSIAYGAAAAPPDLVARAVAVLPGVAFSNVYGQTETLGAVTMLGPDDQRGRPGSVGKVLPGIEWQIDEATGEFQVLQHGAWHGSGDVARVDDEGYLWIEGRLADTINRGGEKLGPVEVEAALRSHPAVTDAAVAGLPDEELGERVGALVVLGGEATPGELAAWCRERLAPWKVPERVAVTDEIPYTDLGKVRRSEIAEIILTSGVSVSR
ncbi:MAG: AMP-binding protein [Actinobacteria bacterium]|nr:AMP-binding protein [Actinomycetota bacterium]